MAHDNSNLYADVLRYQKRAADLSADYAPTYTGLERIDSGLPIYEVGVNNAIVRHPTTLGGIPMIPFMEYQLSDTNGLSCLAVAVVQVTLTRRSDKATLTIGKRYSELSNFNEELHQRNLVRKIDAPTFPEKKMFCEDWWLMKTLEPDSRYVNERREELHFFLKKLFIANPNLFNNPFVSHFFELDRFEPIKPLPSLKTPSRGDPGQAHGESSAASAGPAAGQGGNALQGVRSVSPPAAMATRPLSSSALVDV